MREVCVWHGDAAAHLAALGGELERWDALTADLMATEPDAERRKAQFIERVRAGIAARVSGEEADAYGRAMSLDDCWAGLARYWDKKTDAGPHTAAS